MKPNKNWLENAVIYQIFIDRFAGYKHPDKWDQPVFIGGNLKGITDKLPYIESLGVNAIWLSPHCKTAAYHGYHVTDYYSVDPHFGTENDLKYLIEQAHKRGIKVISDFVSNHCSNEHPYFIDAINNPNSEYKEWFIFDKWPEDYRTFLRYKELPKLNYKHKPAFEHLQNAARKWLSLGFDGFRIDHIVGRSNQDLINLFGPLKKEFPNKVFIGEAWLWGVKWTDLKNIELPNKYSTWLLWQINSFKASNKMYKNYIGILDALNFAAAEKLEVFANNNSSYLKKKVIRALNKQRSEFNGEIYLPTFLDNHDMERFLFRCGNDIGKLKKASELMFSLDYPSIIYYGTEVGMSHNKPFGYRPSHSDLIVRQPMIWDKVKQNLDLLEFYKKMIKAKLNDN